MNKTAVLTLLACLADLLRNDANRLTIESVFVALKNEMIERQPQAWEKITDLALRNWCSQLQYYVDNPKLPQTSDYFGKIPLIKKLREFAGYRSDGSSFCGLKEAKDTVEMYFSRYLK